MSVEAIWCEAGQPAYEALRDLVVRLRAGDPLAPVAVVTPTPAAAVGLRRALARDCGGLAAVSFQSFDALAELLAAPVVGPIALPASDRELLVAAVRVQLAVEPGGFRGIAGHRSTWEAVAAAVEELASLPADVRRSLAHRADLAAEVVRVHDAVAATASVGGRAAMLGVAAERVTNVPGVLRQIGPVVLHAPGRLDGPALELGRALAAAGELHVVATATGEDRADEPVRATVEALGGPVAPPAHASPPAPTRVISANDVDDELRAAVRFVLSRAEAGTPLTSMAVVHPRGAPYTRALAELLRSAGIPFSGPGGESLAQSAPGRVLLGLLEVVRSGFTRQAVVDLWSDGVVVGDAGAPVPSVALDERTRRLGIVGGRAAWHERIVGRRGWLDRNPESTIGPADVVDRRLRRREAELADLDLLETLLATLERLLDTLPTAWTDVCDWVGECLDTLCGPLVRRTGWSAHDIEADTAIRTAVGRLGELAAVEPSPAASVVSETIRVALDAPAPRRTRSGTGLLVTTQSQPPVVPLDTVVVVGMAEGLVPRPAREDVLLGDAARSAVGLSVGDEATADQLRDLLHALGAAGAERVLTYARSEQRSGRTMVPSRWLLDGLERISGQRPRTEALIAGHDVPGVEVVASHRAGVDAVAAGARPALHETELRLAALAITDFDAHPASHDEVVAAGATLARSRAADAFTRFDGNVGDGVDILAEGRNLSPTQIETYASCPRRWFLAHALGVGDVDRPEEVERLQARDKGSLAHKVLERFVGDAIDADRVPEPDEPWGPDGEARLMVIAEEEFADFERQGLTGHPRWWAHDRQEITRVLLDTLRRDDQLRSEHRSRPVAVELTFGRDDQPPLEVTLDDGRTVLLAGQADRVDEVPGGVMVHDYKFGSPSPYRKLEKKMEDGGDPLAGGRRLQLLTYAEAAAQQRGVEPGSAWYWFLKPGYTGMRVGYEIGPDHRRLFRETLRVLVDGIGAGLFPARSGEFDWWQGTNEHCGWCDFDAICPADREDEWDRCRSHPTLGDVARLAEDGAPAFLVTAPVEEGP